jgi:hypothetical protein
MKQESLMKKRTSDKIQGSVKNPLIALFLQDAPMSSPEESAKKGQIRAATP